VYGQSATDELPNPDDAERRDEIAGELCQRLPRRVTVRQRNDWIEVDGDDHVVARQRVGYRICDDPQFRTCVPAVDPHRHSELQIDQKPPSLCPEAAGGTRDLCMIPSITVRMPTP